MHLLPGVLFLVVAYLRLFKLFSGLESKYSKNGGVGESFFQILRPIWVLPCDLRLMELTLKKPIDIASLMAEHQKSVWRFLRMLGCDASQADDFTQETFLRMHEAGSYPYEESSIGPYLRSMARNLYISALRRSSRMTTFAHMEDAEAIWQKHTVKEDSDGRIDALKDCVENLDEKSAYLIRMRFRDKESGKHIANELGTSDNGVRCLLKRIRAKLRDCIERKVIK